MITELLRWHIRYSSNSRSNELRTEDPPLEPHQESINNESRTNLIFFRLFLLSMKSPDDPWSTRTFSVPTHTIPFLQYFACSNDLPVAWPPRSIRLLQIYLFMPIQETPVSSPWVLDKIPSVNRSTLNVSSTSISDYLLFSTLPTFALL